MKILVLNCGSSSIKYKLYNMDDNSVLAAGGVERIGLDEAFIKITLPNGEKKKIMHDMPDHKEGVNFVFQCLLDPEFGAIKSLSEIDAVGHRIVQGTEHEIMDQARVAETHFALGGVNIDVDRRRIELKEQHEGRMTAVVQHVRVRLPHRMRDALVANQPPVDVEVLLVGLCA